MSYLDLSITEIHEALLLNKVTPLELVKEAIQRAKDDKYVSFEYVCEKEALEQVNNLHLYNKNNLLWGVPYVLKDNFCTKNIPTCSSSKILEGFIPPYSSEVYERLTNQGAILIGKTTLDEFAMGGSGTTGHRGRTYNPWDKTKTRHIGGSSCGSAAACASGVTPFAIGSDTGDSARKPAAYSALVGFKPSWGRISRFGMMPFACSLDCVGFFTRNVKDCSIVLEALAGKDEKDLTSSYKEVEEYSKAYSVISNKKIAIIKEICNCITDVTLKELFENQIKALKDNGAIIDYVSVDVNLLKAIYPTYIVISCAESTSNNACFDGVKFGNRVKGKSYEEIAINTRSQLFSEPIKRRLIIGSYSLLKENQYDIFLRAQKCRHIICDKFNEIFENYDAIYLPAAPSIAPTFESVTNRLSDEYLLADNFMAFANFMGAPSIVLPLGFENGLPLGTNLTCKPFHEKELLEMALKIEEITGLTNLISKD